MSRASGLPLARLRAAGCRVHSIIGHYPDAPGPHRNYHYGVVLPLAPVDQVGRAAVVNAGKDAAQDIREARTDLIVTVVRDEFDKRRVLIYVGHPRDHEGEVNYRDDDAVVTAILTAMADELESIGHD